MSYKKSRVKVGRKYKWFPRACVNKHIANTQDLGEAISRRCTVTPADVYAVVRSLPEVMSSFMKNGNSVHLDGLGSFYYKLSCAGNRVGTPEEASREQVKAARVQFIPERRKKCGKYCRALGEGAELAKLGDQLSLHIRVVEQETGRSNWERRRIIKSDILSVKTSTRNRE